MACGFYGWLATPHLKKLTSFVLLHMALDLSRFFDHHILRFTKLLSLFGIRENCHSSGRNPFLYMFEKGDTTDVIIIEKFYCYQLHTKFHPIFFSKG
jgi:hypothetical protein